MAVNIFQNPTKSIPKSDSQIIRVSMTQNEVGGRQDHIPKGDKSDKLDISHVPNKG